MHQYIENLKTQQKKIKTIKEVHRYHSLNCSNENSKIYSLNDYALTKNMFIIGTRQFENKCITAPCNLNPLDIM